MIKCKRLLSIHISTYSESKKQQTAKEIADAQKELDDTIAKMRNFYDYERFDIDYLGDAVLFSKAE